MLFGHNACGHQRYRCKICNHTYTFRNHKNKEFHERVWFKLWIVEGYSIRQLVDISHRGIWKMKNIVSLWLARSPEIVLLNYRSIKHLLCDGTYFNHENCLLAVMDNRDNRIINHIYCIRENYENAMMVFQQLHGLGTRPESITMDGNTSVIRAIKAVWPNIIIQRCLAHIQRQGLSWLRRNPKLAAGKELRLILLGITEIKNGGDKAVFLKQFQLWEQEHGRVVENLSSKDKVFSDLRATRRLLINAVPDMFHYLDNASIPATTNKVEGYFSRLKIIYRQHRGLLKSRRESFFNWYIYFKN